MAGGIFAWRNLPKLVCPLRRKKWGYYANQCVFIIFIIVILFSRLRVPSVMLLSSFCFISLCSGCDLLLLAVWVAAEHGPALFTPYSKLLVERVEIWIFSLAIHCFSEKKLPLLQILGCNQRAACCSNPLPREEGRKHVSAAGLTRISWLIQDFG